MSGHRCPIRSMKELCNFISVKFLERHGIWEAISGGKECVSCQTTKNNWFTAVHHRETPERIKAGQSDAGVVWKTEVLEAHRAGADVDAVTMPDEDSLRAEVACVIGALKPSHVAMQRTHFFRFYKALGARTPMPSSDLLKPTRRISSLGQLTRGMRHCATNVCFSA